MTNTKQALACRPEDSPSTTLEPGLTEKDHISLRTTIVAAKEQISCDLLGEAVILDLKSGIYYGLDEVGARIWALLQEPRQVNEILNALLEEYDVDLPRCEIDLIGLLRQLRAVGLVEYAAESNS